MALPLLAIPPAIKSVLWLVGLIGGGHFLNEAIKSWFPFGEYKIRQREMADFAALQQQQLGAERLAKSDMIQFYRDMMPEQWQRMREQEERQGAQAGQAQLREHGLARELAGAERESRKEELVLGKLLPQAPTLMSRPEIALRGAQILAENAPPTFPARLPFDPNQPISAYGAQ